MADNLHQQPCRELTCLYHGADNRAAAAFARAHLNEDALSAAEEESPEPCPQGCGRTTGDPYGGPCQGCWDAVPTPGRGERG